MVKSKPQQPSKETVKDWLNDRAANRRPLPDQKQIRRELGCDLIDAERELIRHRNDRK